MPVKREATPINISFADYGGFTNLAIATPVNKPSEVLVTLPVIERMLELRADSAREKLEAKSLKPLLDRASNLGKNTETATIPCHAKNCPADFPLPKSRIISAVPFDVFVVVVQNESRKNDAAFNLLVSGFADSFLSVIREQLKQQMSLGDRLTLLKSWQDVMASIRSMDAIELEELIESRSLYPDPSSAAQIRYMKLLQVNDPSIDPLEAMGRSGYLAAFLKAKFSPPVEFEQRQANLVEMADYVINAP